MGINHSKSWASLVSFKRFNEGHSCAKLPFLFFFFNPNFKSFRSLLSLCSILVLKEVFSFEVSHGVFKEVRSGL